MPQTLEASMPRSYFRIFYALFLFAGINLCESALFAQVPTNTPAEQSDLLALKHSGNLATMVSNKTIAVAPHSVVIVRPVDAMIPFGSSSMRTLSVLDM